MLFSVVLIFTAATLPYLWLIVSGFPSKDSVGRWDKTYDNSNPREAQNQFTGWRRRAHYAQLNAHEAFAPFAAAVILCEMAKAESGFHMAAVLFIITRLLHGIFYLLDWARLRSFIWTIGICAVGYLYAAVIFTLPINHALVTGK